MSRHFSFLGLPNYMRARSSTATTGAGTGREAATLPATNLLDEEPSNVARVLSVVPDWAAWRLFAPAYASYLPDAVVLVNSNISPWGMYRFSNQNHHPPWFASSIVGSNNASGAASDVAEDVADTDSFATIAEQTNPALGSWWVRYGGFGIGASPGSSSDLHSGIVVARVGYTGESPTPTFPNLPAAACSIYESGVLRQSLGSRAVSVVTGSGGQVLIWHFNVNLITDMSDLEVRFDFTREVGNVTPHRVVMDCFEVILSTVNPGDDSGWLSPPNAFNSPVEADTNYPAPQVHLSYRAAIGATFPDSTVNIWISDDQTEHDPASYDYRAVSTPSGYLQAGHAILGQAIYLATGITTTKPFVMRVLTTQMGGATLIGQSYAMDAFRQRSGDADLTLTQAENDRLTDAIDFRRGFSGAFFVAADPDAPVNTQVFNSGYVTLDPGNGAGDAVYSSDGGYDEEGLDAMVYKSYRFLEKL